MRSLGLMLAAALISLSVAVFAQPDSATTQESAAQKSFDQMKTLAGVWTGSLTTDPPMADIGNKPMWVTLRVTSRGNALVHEMKKPGTPDDPNQDDPVTLFYVDGNRLLLTHYCDAGNRPRMVASSSPDGKEVEFSFLDLSGGTQHGHMDHAAFTIISPNHHVEDWTYIMPGDKPVHAHMDLHRAQ